jgi:Flp pilus assembly protein TadG
MSKLNNKGQTLILFVILIPIVLVLMALVIDTSYLYKEKTKLESTTKTIIKNNYDKKDSDDIDKIITDLYQKNNIETNNLSISVSDNSLAIKNYYSIDSIFGNIIGIKKYDIKVSLKGIKNNDEIKIIKE